MVWTDADIPATQLPADLEAYCVKCKATRKMTDPQLVTTKNGKPAAKGKCPVCRTTMMKFLPAR
jgi:hypothetical protein